MDKDEQVKALNRTTLQLRVLGAVVAVVAAFTLIQNWSFNRYQNQVMQCQAEFAATVAQAIQGRAEATEADRQAIDNLVTSIADELDTDDRTGIKQALEAYTETRAASDAQRAQNPYPSTSLSERCSR